MKAKKDFKVLGMEDIQFIVRNGSLLNEKELVVLKGGRAQSIKDDCPIKAASDRLS